MHLHFPKPLFTRSELWYHGLIIPVVFPIGNYLFLHERYFTDPAVFGWGTLQAAVVYSLSVIVITTVVKGIFQQYPGVEQVRQRYLLVGLAVVTLSGSVVVLATWLYSLFPVYRQPFSWAIIRTALGLNVVFDVLLCLVLGIQYTYGRWQENQTEKEQLKRAALQHDLDSLKQQINPHFLFNSLTSLSALIGHDTKRASEFVNQLSQIYRYQLSVSSQPLTSLDAEIAFINSYWYLLNTRYQSAISLQLDINPAQRLATLPPLSLQLILDYAIRHNVVSVQKPLTISIRTVYPNALQVQFNLQPRTLRVNSVINELTTLLARYAALPTPMVTIADDNHCFSITLPLLTETTTVPA